MAEPGDILRVQATESKALAQRIVDTLTADLAAAQAAGDEIRATQIRANLTRVQMQEIPTGAQPETVQEATAALREQATVAEQVLAIEERTLLVLREQFDVRLMAENEFFAQGRSAQAWTAMPAPVYPGVPPAQGEYAAGLTGQAAAQAAQRTATAEAEAAAAAQRTAAALAAQAAEARAVLLAEAEVTQALERQQTLRERVLRTTTKTARWAGVQAATTGTPISPDFRAALIGGPQGTEAEAIGGTFAANERSLVRYNLALGEYATFANRAEMSTGALTGGLTRLGIAQVQASDAMRRHGALTTEFLSALGRGETTVQELGYQIGATIGKFAGWTAAATATYGVLGALFELGKGALDTASSVQMLNRTIENVNPDHAAQAIRQLAADVNVSMKEAGDTVFLFSRTFHNVEDAVTAARLALSAYKLDGVAVQDSVKAMTAIHQQFGLSAKGLVPVFDELAQGQQKFNARITDQIPLLQRSAGAVKAMGGNLGDLIKISTIFLRTTQLSGSQGGTAFARSAANFLNPQTSKGQADRAILQSLGIDPNQNYTNLVFDALHKSVNFTNAQRRELALAMFGPQLGARTAGFWAGGGNMLEQVQREMTQSGSRGVLQKELERQLRSAREEVEKLVNGLQRIGAALAETGLLKPLGLMLRGLVGIESVVEHVIELFDRLPAGARTFLSLILELRVAMLALSRTQIGASVGQLPGIRAVTSIIPGARPSAERQLRTDAVIGTRQVISSIDSEVTATGAKLGKVTAATARLQAQLARYNAQIAEVGIESAEGVKLMERANTTYQGILVQQREQVRLEQLQADNLAAQRGYQTQLVGLQKGTIAGPELAALGAAMGANTQAAEAEAKQIGIGEYVQARYGQVMTRLRGVAAASAAAETEAGTAAAGAAAAMSANAAAAASAMTEFEVTNARLAITGEAFTTLGTGTATIAERLRILDAQLAAVDAETLAADAAVVGTEAQLSITSAALVTAGEVWSTFTGALTGLAAGMLSFTGVLIAAPLIWAGLRSAIAQDDAASKAARDALDSTATNMKSLSAHVQELEVAAQTYHKDANSFVNRLRRLGGALVGGSLGRDIAGTAQHDARIVQATHDTEALFQRHFQDYVRGFNRDANALVKSAQGRWELAGETAQLVGGVARELQAATIYPGGPHLSLEEQAKLLLSLRNQLQTGYQKAIDAASAAGGGRGSDPFAQYRGATPKALAADMQVWADRMKVYGATPDLLHRMATLYAYVASAYHNSHNDADLQQVDQARQQYLDAVGQGVQSLLDQAKAAHGRARKLSFVHQANELLKLSNQDLSDTEGTLRKEVATAQAAYEANVAALARANVSVAETDKEVIKGILDNAKAAEASIPIIGGMMAAVNLAVGKLAEAPKQLQRQLEAQVRSSKQAYDTAKANLDGLDKATNSLFAQLDQQQSNINSAQKSAITQTKPKATPASTDPYAIAKLQRELAAAQDEYNPVKAAQDAIAEAQLEVKGARNQSERLHALIDLVHAEHQLDNAIEDQKQATFDLAESRTTDPLKQAVIEMRKAAQKVAFDATHGGLGTQQGLQDQAAYNKAKQNRLDQAITSREDTIKFHLDMNQITTQQAIAEYQGLLKMHGITTAMRRQILLAIYQLQHQTSSEFGNLALGSIRLPTPYEIRRARQAAAGGIAVNQHYSTTIQVSDTASARQVGVVMDNWHRGIGKSVARATARR